MTPAGYTVEVIAGEGWRIVGPRVPHSLNGLLKFPLPKDQAERVAELLNLEHDVGGDDARAAIWSALGIAPGPDFTVVQRGALRP